MRCEEEVGGRGTIIFLERRKGRTRDEIDGYTLLVGLDAGVRFTTGAARVACTIAHTRLREKVPEPPK